jgi:hypothetical protein
VEKATITFKTAPELFYQIYTIHALVDNNILPCVYALLPNKTEQTYYEMFQQLDWVSSILLNSLNTTSDMA